MTDQEINEAVGRKLGVLPKTFGDDAKWGEPWPGHIKDYCHSIEAAWEILETCVSRGLDWQIQNDRKLEKFSCWIGKGQQVAEAYEDTAPMAICLAFLKIGD